MDNARRILRFSCFLLFLILVSACDRLSFGVSMDLGVSKLPPEVTETIHRRWPHARVDSASRSLNRDSWGDYWVTLTLPDGQTDFHQITREGIVKDN